MNTPSTRELNNTLAIFNGKPEVLTAIVKHRTHQRGHLGYLYITRFNDLESVQIAIHPPPAHEEKFIELKFEPPLRDAQEARQRLSEWRDKAFEHFDVPENPVINYFSMPSPFPYAVPLLLAISVQLFALFGKGHYAQEFRSIIAEWGGKALLPATGILAAGIHFIIYPIYVFNRLPQHRVPTGAFVKWLLCIMIIGIGGLNEFWDCVEQEKLSHIYARTDVGRLPAKKAASQPKAKTS